MRIERHGDVSGFFRRVERFLAAREAQHNLMLGFREALERDSHAFGPDDPLLVALVEDGEVVAAATQTPPFNLVLSEMDDLAWVDALADDLAGAPLPGVVGPKAAAAQFAGRWAARTGLVPSVQVEERIYEATAIAPPVGVHGAARPYTPDDRRLVLEWIQAFFDEATPGSAESQADAFLRRRDARADLGLRLWEDGEPVSLAGFGSPTPNGMRVGPVYTPPPRRGRGYASALTAAVSQELLAERRFCFLFTDLANPTSNSIYQRIGYRPVSDVTMWSF